MKRSMFIILLGLTTISSYGQFKANDLMVGGFLELHNLTYFGKYLGIRTQVSYNLSNRTSIGLSNIFSYTFGKGNRLHIVWEPYLRYNLTNNKFGIHADLGIRGASENYKFSVGNPEGISPKIGVGINYFINEAVVLDIMLNEYLFRNENKIIDDQILCIIFQIKL